VSFLPVYIDSSALLKLVLSEPESPALAQALSQSPDLVSSVLLPIECRRIVLRAGNPAEVVEKLEQELGGVTLIRLDEPIRKLAGTIGPPRLRSLDAIHLASALSIGDYPEAFVTYDERLAEAAREAGLNVLMPGS
jgi:predicted nucleic acid-binding protein